VSSVRLDIEYDGTGFSGWARQAGLRTVQGELETALATILRDPVGLTVAGRTDAGVHAEGQVASFSTAAPIPGDLTYRLNGLSPADVAVPATAVVEEGFDARGDALSRTYRYRLHARPASSPFEQNRALWWPHRIDHAALDACAAALPGTHDFTAFTPGQGYHSRFERHVMRSEWVDEPGSVLAFWIEADSFMRHMVRTLVGTMLAVAGGRLSVEHFERLTEGAPRSEAGDTAPAHGLYLESIRY
jgi:tRNA pseudouridine38-40 synthase